jgi:hypothetical protein
MLSKDETVGTWHARVAADHYVHTFFSWSAGAYAWQLNGFWVGVAVLVGLIFVIATLNKVILISNLSREAENPFQFTRLNRWFWLILTWGLLFASSMQVVSAS